jgi:hypothetical protein
VTLAGLSLPRLSDYDPPAAGEGSIDPMGLAAISDRLADRLVPGLRARMQRVRFVTAMAVGALACEELADEGAADGVSTPAIAFEWLVIEALVRRLPARAMPWGVPGSQKARAVVTRSRHERLSAATYLKGPSVFGFNGVYKPFATDTGTVTDDLAPGPRAVELVRAWEADQAFTGFADAVPGSAGRRLRSRLTDAVRASLREGRCAVNPGGGLFGPVAEALRPDQIGPGERLALRGVVTLSHHPTRDELAWHLAGIDPAGLTEAEMLDAVRPSCSPALGAIVDAVVAYERFAALVDAGFRTLIAASYALGAQPLLPRHVDTHEMIVRCAEDLPGSYRLAAERMAAIGAEGGLEERLGVFAIRRSPAALVDALLEHHEQVQAVKPPMGKRPWFEPLRQGVVVRAPFATPDQPGLGSWFVHPVRVEALHRFLEDTR